MTSGIATDEATGVLYVSSSHDISEWDLEFMKANNKDWGHGKTDLYSLITYLPNECLTSVLASRLAREVNFKPHLSFSHLKSYMQQNNEEYYSGSYAKSLKDMSPEEAEEFKSDSHYLPFSGLLNIPRVSFYRDGNPTKPDLFCHYTHFEAGEIIYMFGGLRCDLNANLEALGIPIDTDLSQISVHIPQDLPPYIDKEIFLSPLAGSNPSFITFNSTRGTLHEYPIANMHELGPSLICDMRGTRLPENQVFFCGGFHVKVDRATYKPKLNRWIIEKSISMNRAGYILDINKLPFTKVEIVAKLEFTYCGRVGATICSSCFLSFPPQDIASSLNFDIPELPAEKPVVDGDITIETPPSSVVSKCYSVKTMDSETISVSRTRIKTPESLLFRSPPTLSSTKARPAVVTSPTALTKKASLLSKSSRFFHRSLTKQSSSSSNQSSVYSSYSNQVKQYKLQNLPVYQQDSRAPSPLLSAKSPGKLTIDIHLANKDNHLSHTLVSLAQPTLHSRETVNAEARARVNSDSPPNSVTSEGDGLFAANEGTKSEVLSVCIYLFGGFCLTKDPDTAREHFVANNSLLKIELLFDDASQIRFHNKALMVRVPAKGGQVPLPRGYFAYTLVDRETFSDPSDPIRNNSFDLSELDSPKLVEILSDGMSNDQKPPVKGNCFNLDSHLSSKRLLIQGGVDDKNHVYGDFYSYCFSTATWQKHSTHAFDYYNVPKKPYEDEELENMSYESQVADAVLKEAELRCCHHQALTYWEEGKQHVIFMGGFSNDYLRHFDNEPYNSDLLDVSRFARFLFCSPNSNLLRLPILKVSTRTWKFSRFFYDLRDVTTSDACKILTSKYMHSARVTFVGGTFLLVGKQLTIFQGLTVFVPEKEEGFKKLKQDYGSCVLLLGGHLHLTFPGI